MRPPGPPFTITVQAADHLARIVESITRLDFGTDFRLDLRLHRENRVRSIHSSLAIEGNHLSLEEVSAVLDGRAVWGRPSDIHEVKNAHAAYAQLRTFDPYDVDDFLAAHRLMTQGLIREAGVFRSGDVAVYAGDAPVHVGARPQFVPGLVSDLFAWAREMDVHPVLRSAIVHCEIETIHPFADGNGRLGRLWQTLILASWNETFASLPMESVVFENRPAYYQALRSSQRDNDATAFIEFSLGTVRDAIDEALVTYDAGGRAGADVGANVGEGVGVSEAVLVLLRASIYLDLYAEFRKDGTADKESINDDIVFEIELIKQVEINVDYILMLVQKWRDIRGDGDDKEIAAEKLQRAIDSSLTLRNKKDLIMDFVDRASARGDIDDEWRVYVETRKTAELDQIIAEEGLKPDETKAFVEHAFRDGRISAAGTAVTRIMPPSSRFSAGGGHGEKKQRVLARLQEFVGRFLGLASTS